MKSGLLVDRRQIWESKPLMNFPNPTLSAILKGLILSYHFGELCFHLPLSVVVQRVTIFWSKLNDLLTIGSLLWLFFTFFVILTFIYLKSEKTCGFLCCKWWVTFVVVECLVKSLRLHFLHSDFSPASYCLKYSILGETWNICIKNAEVRPWAIIRESEMCAAHKSIAAKLVIDWLSSQISILKRSFRCWQKHSLTF